MPDFVPLNGPGAPNIGSQPISPIFMDAGVDYQYVVPVQGETGISVAPVAGFTFAVDGRVVTMRYTGTALASDTNFSVPITASNNLGNRTKNVGVRVRGGLVRQIDPSFFGAAIDGSANFRYQTTHNLPASAQPINGKLGIGSKLKLVELISGTASTGLAVSTVVWVVRVDDSIGQFRVSATSGGAEITPDENGTYWFEIATIINTSELLYVGDTSRFTVDQPLALSYTNGAGLPTGFDDPLFVKELVGAYYIRVTDAIGNAPLAADADSFAADHNVRLVADSTGGRQYPAIDSDPEMTIADGTAIADYTITTDIVADSFAVQGLPAGLSLVDDTISGTPVNLGKTTQFRIKLIAYLKGRASFRYWLLNVVGAVDLDPDFAFDLSTRRIYSVAGPAGRADRIDVTLGDPPLLIALRKLAADFEAPAGTVIRFGIKEVGANKTVEFADDFVVFGTATLAVADQQFAVGEDWNEGALVALFAQNQRYIDFVGQLAIRFPADPDGYYRKSVQILVRVWNNEHIGVATGAGTGSFIQTKPFIALVGGTPTVEIDSVPTLALAVETWSLKVIRTIDGARSLSEWFLVDWDEVTADADEATSAARGIVIPDDFDAVTNPKMWIRVGGV